MKYILLITSMLLTSPAFSTDILYTHQPYFGIDGQWHSMNNSSGGDTGHISAPTANAASAAPAAQLSPTIVLPHVSPRTNYGAPAFNIYAGTKFNACYGIESGYSINVSKNYHTYKFMKHSLHTSIMMFMPINPSFELIGGLGYTVLHHVVSPISKACLIHVKERSSLTKLTPRAIAGMQLYSYERLSVRLSVSWEYSKKMRIPGFNFHDSLHYGIGIQHKI